MELYFLETTRLLPEVSAEEHPDASSPCVSVESLDTSACGAIVRVLGLIKGDRLIYISSDHAVCSFQLRCIPEQRSSRLSKPESVTRPEPTQSQQTGRRAASHKSSVRASSEIPDKRVKGLFALPDDWANDNAVKSSTVWHGQSSLLYPRNGQVAVVRCKGLA